MTAASNKAPAGLIKPEWRLKGEAAAAAAGVRDCADKGICARGEK